jgi:DNA-binding NarL/FixJ family response regulator
VIRVVLAEDHEVVRAGLRSLLGLEVDMCLVGEASHGLEVEPLVARTRPHVVLLDLCLPGLGGLTLIRLLRRDFPAVRILVLSMHADEAYAGGALEAGADAYVPKCAPSGEIQRGIRAVVAGSRFIGAPLSETAVRAAMVRGSGQPIDRFETLTPRERQAFQLAAEGLSNPDIAARLNISTRTAESHRGALLRKLGVRNQAELVRLAANRGMLPPPGPPPPP